MPAIDPDALYDAVTSADLRPGDGWHSGQATEATEGQALAAKPTPRWSFRDGQLFTWKVIALAVTTIAFVPILLWRHELAATVYIVSLVAVHIAGIVVVALGVRKAHVAPSRRAFVLRLVAIAILVLLLSVVGRGLTGQAGVLFWVSLAGLWLLHTAGLALLHIQGRASDSACPFL